MSVSTPVRTMAPVGVCEDPKLNPGVESTKISGLKIAHVNDYMEMGGSEKLTAILCRLQRALGHSPSVHCLFSVGVLGNELRAEGLEVVLHGPLSAIKLMRSLYRNFRSSTPDVVHCHNPTAAVLAALPARLAGVRTVIATRHSLVQPPYNLRSELRFAVASRWCDWIVGVCETTRRNLMGAPLAARKKIVHIYNGAAADTGAVPRAKSGFTLLHVGRMAPDKDQATLLRALAIARAQNPNMNLWLIGNGPLEADLQYLSTTLGLDDCVTFFGEQTNISPFLVAADLFVMPSITEGMPLALLEAMSVGLPAVVTDVGGMGEIARLSGAAILVPPSDPESLAKALCEAAANRERLPQTGRSALRCYRENFTPELMVSKYLRLYSHVPAHQ